MFFITVMDEDTFDLYDSRVVSTPEEVEPAINELLAEVENRSSKDIYVWKDTGITVKINPIITGLEALAVVPRKRMKRVASQSQDEE